MLAKHFPPAIFKPPGTSHDPAAIFSSGRHVILGVPGAFTLGCTKTHLPGYVSEYEDITGKGVSSINRIAVNDAIVMGAWGAANGAEGKIRMLADPADEYVTAAVRGLTTADRPR